MLFLQGSFLREMGSFQVVVRAFFLLYPRSHRAVEQLLHQLSECKALNVLLLGHHTLQIHIFVRYPSKYQTANFSLSDLQDRNLSYPTIPRSMFLIAKIEKFYTFGGCRVISIWLVSFLLDCMTAALVRPPTKKALGEKREFTQNLTFADF
jgi:hypothetical protein